MTLEDKKTHVLLNIKLGLDIDACFILSLCTDADKEILLADQEFMKQVLLHQRLEERELLIKHNDAINANYLKGNTKPIEFKLKLLNPERYGGQKYPTTAPVANNINIMLEGKAPSE